MKKTIKVAALAIVMTAIAFATPKQASAAQKFEVSYIPTTGTSVTINLKKSPKYYTEVELSKANGKVVDTKTYYKGATAANFLGLKKNTAYCARYRAVEADGTPVSSWSKKIGFVSLKNVEPKQVGKSMKVYYKLPKVKGVKKFKVTISKKQKSGYKTVGTVKPGKKIIISKCYGKALSYTSYYVRIQPVFAKKVKNTYKHSSGFYFRRGYF